VPLAVGVNVNVLASLVPDQVRLVGAKVPVIPLTPGVIVPVKVPLGVNAKLPEAEPTAPPAGDGGLKVKAVAGVVCVLLLVTADPLKVARALGLVAESVTFPVPEE
jgi:hypothetical protein